MAEQIKGITVEIGGDATGLEKALGKVNKESSTLQKELNQVNRLLKYDPQNTEVMAQKQQILTEQVEKTKDKLDALRQAEKEVQQQVSEGKISQEQYREFQREIIKTENQLKAYEDQLKGMGGAYENVGKSMKALDNNSAKLKAELKEVNEQLKLDPKNTELLSQKQKLLAESVENTKDKLNLLKEAEQEVQEQFERGDIGQEQYREFQREIVKTENELKELQKESKELGTELSRAFDQAAEKTKKFGEDVTDIGKKIAPVSAAAAAVGTASVKVFSDFDDAMRQVQATMGGTEEDLLKLTEAAKKMGADTRYSATDASNALNYLALAGYDTNKAIETLPKVLSLAAAGNLDLAYASDLVTDSMAALGKESGELDEFIDKMARTSQKSNTNVAQLGEATLVVAGQANLAQMELTDLNTALGILADNGIKGSEGGTALRNALKNLMTPTSEGAKALKSLNVEIFDSQGNMRNMQDILKDLNGALSGLTAEEKTSNMAKIFDTRTIAAANALLKDSGERWDELSASIDDAKGTAQSMSDTLESGIGGSFRELKSGTEAVAISIGEVLAPTVQDLAKWVKGLTEKFNGLSDGKKKLIVILLLVVAALGPLLLIIGQVALGVSALMGILPVLGAAFTALGGPIGLIVAAVGVLIAIFVHLWNTNEDFKNGIIAIWDTIWSALRLAFDAFKALFSGDFKGFFENILKLAGTLISGFGDIGKNIVKGIWEGIKNMADWFYSQISGFFSGIVGKVKKALGIQSPSKVFAEIGKFMALGLDEGWAGQIRKVQKNVVNGLNGMTQISNATDNSRSMTQYVSITSSKALDEMEIIKQTRAQGQVMKAVLEG